MRKKRAEAEFTDEDAALLAELGLDGDAEEAQGPSAREERILAGFEEVQAFVRQYRRLPRSGGGAGIFEQIYAIRLERLRDTQEGGALAAALEQEAAAFGPPVFEDAAQERGALKASDLTELRHVRSNAERKSAEEIAERAPCRDFARFKPMFERLQEDLAAGLRKTRNIRKSAGFLKSDVKAGDWFILGGQTAYVADIGPMIRAPNGEADARLRVIYSNGTESNLLLRSLQRALYKDEASRRISEAASMAAPGPLFEAEAEEEAPSSGTVYVLRSKSDHPLAAAHRDVLHKIGVTGGDVERRIAGARFDPTFLMADVELVASYRLENIRRVKLEGLLHRLFEAARLDVKVTDRFGKTVTAREWFLVPLFVIDEAMGKIRDGSLEGFRYDPQSAALVLMP